MNRWAGRRRVALGALSCLAYLACGGRAGSPSRADCTPGDTRACDGNASNQCAGTQACRADGNGWSACSCAAGGAGGETDASRAGSEPAGGSSYGGASGRPAAGRAGSEPAGGSSYGGASGRPAAGRAGSEAAGSNGMGGSAGTGGHTVQPPTICGNGIVDQVTEQCDDGNRAPFDGCSGGCKLEPYAVCPPQGGPCVIPVCGNGVREGLEQCDDGNRTPGDGCNALCEVQSVLWECPVQGGPCTFWPTCGNGVIENGEVCDDGNLKDGDDCASDCRTVPSGRVCLDEPCEPWCGDGIVTDDELCDDGENVTLDYGAADGACAPGCVLPPRCGDGVLDPPEECDDGDGENRDGVTGGCSLTCTRNRKEPECGDSALAAGEECDYGDSNEPPESVSYGGCTTECKFGPRCGDGRLDMFPLEDCDDGNLANHDGCSSVCITDWELFADGGRL
jgi:cysteine-rich repeat protein